MNAAVALVPSPPSASALEVGSVVRAVTPRVIAAVRAVLGHSHADFDDAVQLSLMAFIQALPAFRGDCDPAGYARVIAVRTAIALRKRHRAIASRHDGFAEPDAVTCARPTPAEVTNADQRRNVMRDLLGEMPDEQSETLALRVCLGWTLEEIAKETGAPLNTVRSRLRLAKERLRQRIEGDAALRETFDRE